MKVKLQYGINDSGIKHEHGSVLLPIKDGASSIKKVKIGVPFEIEEHFEKDEIGKERKIPVDVVKSRLIEHLFDSPLELVDHFEEPIKK